MQLKKSQEDIKQKPPIDYRFSLANERTFLAWIRTALAFLAGAVAIDQFIVATAFPEMRLFLAIFLAIIAAFLSVSAYFRWRANDKAMHANQALPYNHLLSIISIMILVASFCFIILFFVGN